MFAVCCVIVSLLAKCGDRFILYLFLNLNSNNVTTSHPNGETEI